MQKIFLYVQIPESFKILYNKILAKMYTYPAYLISVVGHLCHYTLRLNILTSLNINEKFPKFTISSKVLNLAFKNFKCIACICN